MLKQTNLSLHWNWPRGNTVNTGRSATASLHFWRMTQWLTANHSTGSTGLTDSITERNLGGLKCLTHSFLCHSRQLYHLFRSFRPVTWDPSYNTNHHSSAFWMLNAVFSSTASLKNTLNIHPAINLSSSYLSSTLTATTVSSVVSLHHRSFPSSNLGKFSCQKSSYTSVALPHCLPSWVPLPPATR